MISGYSVYYYLSPSGDNPIKEFLDSLEEKKQEKILRIFQNIKEYGMVSVISHIKKLTGTDFWEIRILGKDNIRIIYVIPIKEMVLVLHGFNKKSQKTSKNDINIASSRYYDWIKRSKLLDK